MSRTPATDADVAEIRSELYGIVEFTDWDIEGLVLRIDADTRRLRALERIVADTLWMARRYADGRQSYATGMYNDAARLALSIDVLGTPPDGTWWAEDAGGREFSRLSEEEWQQMKAAKEGNA